MEHGTEEITRLVIQLAAILVAAKVFGELFQRFLKLPAVLGELAAGILIGPFALGAIEFPVIGALFHHLPDSSGGFQIPVSESLWAISQVGSIVLLFMAGLETDLRQFLRYSKQATLVATGGVVLPFVFGVALTVILGYADGIGDVRALFIGAVLTATSIGITVRVLGDIGKLGTPEGVTILGAAVLDDVIGILILTIVVGLETSGQISAGSIGFVAIKTIGFWLALTGVGILLSRRISDLFSRFEVSGAALALALALAFLAAGLAESFGLAMIIGAFSIGLALSDTDLAQTLEEPLGAVYAALVPIFFVVMGMLVDLGSLSGVIGFGALLTVFAVVGKVLGSGGPALLVGFNLRGSWRIGIGMLPRGEVALIMGGIGVSSGILDSELYGVAIIMTIITTALAPPILSASFSGGEVGIRENPENVENDA